MSPARRPGFDAAEIATILVGLGVFAFGILYLRPKESFLPPPTGSLETGLIVLGMFLGFAAVVFTILRHYGIGFREPRPEGAKPWKEGSSQPRPAPRTAGSAKAPAKASAAAPAKAAAAASSRGAATGSAKGPAKTPAKAGAGFQVRSPALVAPSPTTRGGAAPAGTSAALGVPGGAGGVEASASSGTARPMGPSIPFAAAFEDSATELLGPSARQVAALRREADEQRARFRDFERSSATVAGPFGPVVSRSSDRPVVEPPLFRDTPLTAHGKCASCGDGLPQGRHLALCWTCGRPMCATCYWRSEAGSEPHRCAGCRQRSRSVAGASLSGGRASAALTPTVAGAEPTAVAGPVPHER